MDMPVFPAIRDRWFRGVAGLWAAGMLLLLTTLPLMAQGTGSSKPGDGDVGFGVNVSKKAGPREVGLPIYPGARPHRDNSNDDPAVQLGAWGGKSGFKLVVVKLESSDSPARVAQYYRKALARYGKVLDCSDSSNLQVNGKNSSDELDCGDDHPEPGKFEFKAGTKDEQHVVGIEPNGSGSVFQLVYVQARGSMQ